jgi:hypothetical protein
VEIISQLSRYIYPMLSCILPVMKILVSLSHLMNVFPVPVVAWKVLGSNRSRFDSGFHGFPQSLVNCLHQLQANFGKIH